MPCRIKIEQSITDVIEERTDDYLDQPLTDAQLVANSVNADFGTNVVSFSESGTEILNREITIPEELISEYYDNEIALEKKPKGRRTSTIPSTASPKTVAVVKDFLKRIGVETKGVNQVVVGGVPLAANGVAVMAQHLVQVVNGKEAQALPEEGMHFAVEILEQKNSSLFNKLMKEINSYQIYKDVLAEYGTDPLYTTADGKPDIRKLKKEAIAKVLVETIINQNENTNESPEKIKQAQTWWDQIINYLKELFLTSGFDAAAMKILSGEDIGTASDIKSDSVYLQKSKQDEVIDNVLTVHRSISKDTVKNPEGGEEEKYFINGRQIKWRVSNLTKTWFDKLNADNALTNSEYQNAVNTLKADKGTDGHHDLEYIHGLFFDKDGNRRAVPLDDEGYQSQLNPNDNTMYNLLKDNYEERINTYPEGTKILSEVTVYDPKRDVAGTIDYMAVMPDGKVDLLDWKFKVINTDVYEDIPWYNIASWNRQMGQYKTILQNNYGIKSNDFRQTMMVPIRAHYTLGNAKGNILPKLDSIEIGDVDIKNITDDYLIPVGLESQKTGVKKLDKLLEKLNALYKKLSEQKALPSEKANKNEQLNALFKAIRHLQMKQSIEPLLDQAKTLNKQMEMIMDKYTNTFQGKDKSEFTDKQIDDFAKEIHLAEEVLDSYQELNNELKFMFTGKELTEEEKALKEDLRDVVEDVRDYKSSIADMYTEFTVDFIGGTETAEKIVKGLTKWFGSTATIQLKGLEDLYKKANKAFAYTGMDVLKETKRLREIRDSFTRLATAKGLTQKNMFNIIKKADKNELIDEFDPEFYSEMKKRIQNKDYAWIKDNIDVDAYETYLDKKLEEELQRIESKPYAGEERKAAFAKESDIRKATDKYSINTDTSVGWLLYNDISKFPDREKWESDEWKELHKPENKPALDFYNYIRERNELYASIGYINNPQARKFLPWVRKSFFENVVFDGKVTIGEQFLRNISIDESDVGYGKIDPITGKPIDSLPKYFTSEIENASGDLFKTMELYNEMAIKFSYLSEIENQGRALIRLEKNKKAIATSVFGRTAIDEITGELKINPNNTENSNLVESMVKAIIYQQKYIESETFDQLLGKLGRTTEKINKTLGFKLLPENLENRQVSVNKSISTLNNFFQVKTLGLNPLSSLSNLFGGKTQSLINSGKYFTKSDFVSTEMWLLANKMNGSDKQKMLAALEYFLPFTHDYNRDNARKLSLNKIDDQVIQDFLMVLMRKGEDAVQTTNFYAFLRNSIVQDGKVVNTREYLRTTPEFEKMYEGTKEEREARSDRFEEEVKKLNASQGIINVGTVVNGEFVIPGVDQKDASVVELRRKVQQFSNDALGSASEENKRTINMTVYGNSFMIFKNWIPRLVDVRMGGLKYNAASDAYEWGRMRTVTKIIGDDFIKSIGRLTGTLTASDKGIEYLRELYESKRTTYAQETGKTLEMTEDQFIELVRQNVKNQLLDVLIYGTLFAIFWGLKANAPDDDEDPQVKNTYKFLLKATDKFKDEIGYFYDPSSLSSLVGSGIFPSIGLINDYKRLFSHTMTELYGLTVEDDELIESNKTIKYWLRTFPVLNQGASMLPMFYPDLSKDLGIKMQGQYGFR